MACHLQDDSLFFVLAGVARDRRAEIGDAADLRVDPVFAAALVFLGMDHWRGESDPEQRMERSRGVLEAMRLASLDSE